MPQRPPHTAFSKDADAPAGMQGVGDALTRIVKDEGVAGLFRGAGPTVARAMALNMGMLASNDQVLLSLPELPACKSVPGLTI